MKCDFCKTPCYQEWCIFTEKSIMDKETKKYIAEQLSNYLFLLNNQRSFRDEIYKRHIDEKQEKLKPIIKRLQDEAK